MKNAKRFIIFFLSVIYCHASGQNNVSRLEYFFNTDPGFGNGTPYTLNPAWDVDTSFTIDVSGLNDGINLLYVRAKNDSGWSIPVIKPFYKNDYTAPALSTYEYFFDTDPGILKADFFPFSSTLNMDTTFLVSLSSLSNGIHVFYSRAIDQNGNVGVTYIKPVLVNPAAQVANIVRLEYFFDTDPGYGNADTIAYALDTVWDKAFNLLLDSVDPGIHVLYMRARDENGNWSDTYNKPFLKLRTDQNIAITGIEYFFDADPGFGNGIPVALQDTFLNKDTAFTLQVDTTVTPGIHVLYVRVLDENQAWSMVYNKPVLIQPGGELNPVKRIEYFYDADPGFGNGNPVDFSSFDGITLDTSFVIPFDTLSEGMYVLHVRAQSRKGDWSFMYSRLIAKLALPDTLPDLTAFEYYLDSDPGYGNGTVVSISDTSYHANLTLDLTGISQGLHVIYLRARDNEGQWSQVFSRPVLVVGSSLAPNLTDFEYYYDSDPGYGNGHPVSFPALAEYRSNLAISLSGLSKGLHTIYLRGRDENGNWSQVYSRPLLVSGTVDKPRIIEIEYALDDDPGFNRGITIPVDPDSIVEDTLNIALDTVPGGPHRLYIRAKDENDNYSITFVGQFCKGAVPKFIADSVCFGEPTLFTDLTIDPEDTTTYLWDFNSDANPELDTSKGTIEFVYPEAGEHEASLVVYDHPACTDTFSLPVRVYGLPPVEIGNDTVICENENLVLGTSQIFNSYLWVDGSAGDSIAIDTTGIYWLEVSDSNNCYNRDSVNVLINPIPYVSIGNDTSLCEYQTLFLDAGSGYESYLWSTGPATRTLKVDSTRTYWVRVENTYQCFNRDSVFVRVNPRPYLNLGNDTAVCDNKNLFISAQPGYASYLWNTGSTGQVILAKNSGFYWSQVTDSNNCFNRDTIGVTLKPSPVFSLGDDRELCDGEFIILEAPDGYNGYLWSDGSATPALLANASGTYWVRVTNVENCISTDTVHLEVHPLPDVQLGNDTVIMKGESITLDAGVENASYYWKPAGQQTRTLTVQKKGYYEVNVVDQYNCRNADTIFITVIDNQQIQLRKGWNIISMYVKPESNNLQDIMQSLIDEGSLLKVQDERGWALEPIEGEWINTIAGHLATEGYYVKVDTSTSLAITGETMEPNMDIPLYGGWNVVSFPLDDSTEINEALGSFLGMFNFQKLQNETGSSYEYVYPLGYVENIDSLVPGEGYKIRVMESMMLNFAPILKSAKTMMAGPSPETRFKAAWEGNGYDHMHVFIRECVADGMPLQPGDEIAVFDGETCVGIHQVVSSPAASISIPVTRDDPLTPEKDGFTEGNAMTFRLWRTGDAEPLPDLAASYHPAYENRFMAKSTVVVNLQGYSTPTHVSSHEHPFIIGRNHPNPFMDHTLWPLELNREGRLKLEIFDVTGNSMGVVMDSEMPAGNYEIMIRKADYPLSSGLYICMFTFDGQKALRKVVVR